MNIKDLRNLTHDLCKYRMNNQLTYSEFCDKADISHNDLVALQVGNYAIVPEDVIEKVKAVVYECS